MRKLLWLFALFCCTNLFATPIKHLVFFGDSLTDDGNFYRHNAHIMPKDPPYYQGRFSNGPVWAEYLGQYYGEKFGIEYANYAVGGATAILRNPFKGFLPLEISEEIYDYLFIYTPFQDRSDTLFFIMAGANDYNTEKDESVNSITTNVVNAIKSNVELLIRHGGKHFVLIDVPDLSKVPRMQNDPKQAERLAKLSILNHEKMLDMINVLKNKYPDLSFSFVSMYEIFNDVLGNMDALNKKYGTSLSDATHSCWAGDYTLKKAKDSRTQDVADLSAELQAAYAKQKLTAAPTVDTQALAQYMLNSPSLGEAYRVGKLKADGLVPCENPDTYVFWDQVHPTNIVHQVFADIVAEELAKNGVIVDNRAAK